jgi:UDP-N-acetylmuramyl pentapeptide phosphotransferase/UDP-N-acetylglucosamine-1-phosphate transferase
LKDWHFPFPLVIIALGRLGVPLSVLCIVTVTNVVNFIVVLTVSSRNGSDCISHVNDCCLENDYFDVVVMSVALAGACFGFLFYKFSSCKDFHG